MRTIIATGPKRSGGSLLARLFDHQPNVLTILNEGYFWEHAYKYIDHEDIFVDLFRQFDPHIIMDAMTDRDILPCLDGIYRYYDSAERIRFREDIFFVSLKSLKNATTIGAIWDILVNAYAKAVGQQWYTHCFIFSGDYGRSILAAQKFLEDFRGIFYMRDPLYALDSLKKARQFDRPRPKPLHIINLMEAIEYYSFISNHYNQIFSEKTKLIQFESLIYHPDRTMREVADHVGISYNSNLITPTLEGKPLHGIDKTPAERDITELTKAEIDFINKHLATLFKKGGK